MAIAMIGAGGLFTRLGKVAKLAYILRQNQTTLSTNIEAIRTACEAGTPITTPLSGFDSRKQTAIRNNQSYMNTLVPIAISIVEQMVFDDVPSQAKTNKSALKEVVRQMEASGDTVKRFVTTTVATPGSGNFGDGKIYIESKDYRGIDLQFVFPETDVSVSCVQDSQSGNTAFGNEGFLYNGNPFSNITNTRSPWDYLYLFGSGSQQRFSATDPNTSLYASATLSDYSSVTPFGPTGWIVSTGTSGVDFDDDSAVQYGGLNTLKFIGGGASAVFLRSPKSVFRPKNSAAFNVYLKASAALTGEFRCWITDSSGTTLTGGDGQPMVVSVDASTVGTAGFLPYGGIFRFPQFIPTGSQVRFGVTTPITGGNLNASRLCLSNMTQLYSGGPFACIFSGFSQFVVGDTFTLDSTNDYAGASDLGSWQIMWERLFTPLVRGDIDLVLPSTIGTPTINDSLITS